MAENPLLGSKVKALRKAQGITQAELAGRLGVSASYVNLIENNRRPLSANLLLKLASEFQLDLADFSGGDEGRIASDLAEVFADPMLSALGVGKSELAELAATQGEVARAVLTLYRAYRGARSSVESLSDAVASERSDAVIASNPTEEVNDFVQTRGNYFPSLESAAEDLWKRAGLRFGDVNAGLIRFLEKSHGIEVRIVRADAGNAMRRFDRDRQLIELSEVLPPRTRRFQLAHQIALITQSDRFDELADTDGVTTAASRALARVVLANYFAAALLMPYELFKKAATEARYDVELLAHRYQTSFEQTCHRLTTLRRPGSEGIPLHFLRIDIAGNISKSFSASGMRIPRFSGACPRWNVHEAFLTPGMFNIDLERTPEGITYFCVARTVQRAAGGYNLPHTVHSIGIGCQIKHARQMVYSDGIDLDTGKATPVGTTCRTCERTDCQQRAFPSVQQPLDIDEDRRGMSFFASPDSSD